MANTKTKTGEKTKTAEPKIETLDDALNAFKLSRTVKPSEGHVIEGLKNLLKCIPYDCERKSWVDAVERLANTYFALRFAKHYECISLEILDLETTAVIPSATRKEYSSTRTYKDISVTFPLFSAIPYGAEQWTWEGKSKDDATLDITLSAAAPALTREVKEKAAEAQAVLCEEHARALRIEPIREVLHLNR